jgi:hypothetical protein
LSTFALFSRLSLGGGVRTKFFNCPPENMEMDIK